MSERSLRTTNVAAGALLIGGLLVAPLPGRALSVVQVVVVALAAATALWVLASAVPPTGWISPFKWMSPFGGVVTPRLGHRSHALGFLRDRLGDRRQPVEGGPPLPPAVLRRLRSCATHITQRARVEYMDGSLNLPRHHAASLRHRVPTKPASGSY